MKFLLCCILLQQVSIIYGRQVLKSPTNGKDAGVEFVKQAQSSLKSGDLGGFITAVGTVGAYIPGPEGMALLAGFALLGMAITAITGNKTSPASPFLDKIRESEVMLEEIAETIKGIEIEFSENLAKSELFDKSDTITLLQEYWLDADEAKDNKLNFINKCKEEKYDHLPRYFSMELTGHDLSTGLAKQYIADLDRWKYLNFASSVLIYFTEAAMLQFNCTVAAFENHPDLNKTLEFYKIQNAGFWNEMKEAMIRAQHEFDKNIFDHVKHFVKNYIEQHRSKNAQELHSVIYSKLTTKYYWRKWVLMIRDAPHDKLTSLREYAPGLKDPSYYRPLNVAGKTFVLFSPEENANGPKLCPYMEYCEPELYFDGCDYIIDKMKDCVDRKVIRGVGCISDLGASKVVANASIAYPSLVYQKSKCKYTFVKGFTANGQTPKLKLPAFYVYWIK